MEYLYIVFLTLFISICCLKYFDVTVDKKNILLVIIISLCCCMINFLKLPDMLNTVIRDSLIYLFIRKYISKDRDLEIVSIILVLETIAKCSYYLFVLFVPLIIQANISNILLYSNYELKILSLFILFVLMAMYFRSSYFLNVRCNRITYALLSTCSVISLYGLEVIPTLGNQIKENQLYFLLLSFMYIVLVNIIIYIYHNQQTQQEIENKVVLEQARILKQEKDIISIQNKMIENIKHDLNYFKEMVNDGAKDHLNGTIKKIDKYNSNFIFEDYLLNNFISRMKTEMKENNKDLKLIITNTNISIDLTIYNQLISIMEFIIQNSLERFIQFRIHSLENMSIFEFTYMPKNKDVIKSKDIKNNENIVFNQAAHQYMVCSLILEGERSYERNNR